MTTIALTETDLVDSVSVWDRPWALKRQLTTPLAHVVGASVDPSVVSRRKGLRAPGTYPPGVITTGNFRLDGDWVFWEVHDPTKAIVVELADERYARLVVEVEDPAATVAAITSARAARVV